MSETEARDAEFAINQLKELADNLQTACFVLSEAFDAVQEKKIDLMGFVGINRMTMSWIVLSLFKVDELWRKYGRLAKSSKEGMKAVLKESRERGVPEFRNKVVAHLLDQDTKDPVEPERLQTMMVAIWRNDVQQFARWLANPDPAHVDTVVRTLMSFRAEILMRHPSTRIYI